MQRKQLHPRLVSFTSDEKGNNHLSPHSLHGVWRTFLISMDK
ncbi:hypothetical protein HMPREF3226_02344 [Prevotella corporis]|uniref:Uncharacterized protein n=1 Tax=Prevotella corporis TaxID=28128 RepID=A0A133PW74_9BACT|nr:hypothetical protein HMPREF3226_02344 [Prevotella corporis]